MCGPEVREAGSRSSSICATTEFNREILASDPVSRANFLTVSQFNRVFQAAKASLPGPALIPVVFHVVYNKDQQNLTDDQIDSQLRVLNEDFRASNKDIANVPSAFQNLVGDAQIGFYRSRRDPKGKEHSGIVRVKTNRVSFPRKPNGGINTDMKYSARGGSDAWPRERFLNIWLCNFGDNLLGYAAFPGLGARQEDGVVLNYKYVGYKGSAQPPYNLGRTATHEIGHWLNLRHIWGDDGYWAPDACAGTDFVDDTPNQSLNSMGKPNFPKISCNNGPNGDMFMNFMDYTDDDVTIMFTKGQAERMKATVYGWRSSVVMSSFQDFLLKTGTAFPEAGDNWKFLVGDVDNTGQQDLVGIKIKDTDLGKTEVHVSRAADNYKTFRANSQGPIPFDTKDPGVCDYMLARYAGSTKPSLYVVQRGTTDSDKASWWAFTGDSNFQQKESLRPLPQNFHSAEWSFLMGDWFKNTQPDLFCIQRSNNTAGKVHVHIYPQAESQDQVDFETAITNVDRTVDFLLTDYNGDGKPDLVVIRKSPNESTLTKVQILSGASGYEEFILEVEIALRNTSAEYDFAMADWSKDGRPDLIAMKKSKTATGSTEVHVLAG